MKGSEPDFPEIKMKGSEPDFPEIKMKEGSKASKTDVLSENDCVGTGANRKSGTADGVVKSKETQEERCVVPPVFVTPLITRLVPEGKVVVMETKVFSGQAVDFTWLFNHQSITPSSSSYAISNKEYKSILFIYDACQNLAGEYTCIANNDAGIATTSAYLIVEEPKSEREPPCFNVHLSPPRWSTAEPIRLVCYVSGKPFPRIRWYHNRTELVESKRVFMSLQKDGRCELTIQKACLEDAGEYICEAVNKWGEVVTKTRMEVESCKDSLILDQVTSGEAKEQLEEMICNGKCCSVHDSSPKSDCMVSESEDHPSEETNILNRLQGEDERPYNVILPESTEKMKYSNKDEEREEGHSRDCLASLIPPLQIKVTGPSSISIQWIDDHSIPVLGYCILLRDVKQKIWMEVCRVDGHTKQVTVRDLQEDHKYFVRIIAFSEAGVSEPLTNESPVRVVRPADVIVPPAAPEGPLKISDVTEDSVKLTWQTSKNDGGAEITAYVIEAKDVLETEVVKHYRRVAATETSYLMSGLKKGHLFLFRVSAENAAGVGPALINKTPVRIRAIRMKPSPPGKPVVNLSREAGDSVHLSWTPPEFTGSATIRTYIVERYDLLSDIWMRINREEFTSPVFTVTGLQPGLEYIYRVSAENEVGISEPGPSSEPVIIRTKRGLSSALVVAPPIFTLKLENRKVVEENDVTFYCEFSGSPSPEITWYKGGIEVFDSSRVTIYTDNKSSSLTLRNVKMADSGKLECQALSVSGLATTRAQLSVDAPPKVIIPSRYLNGLFFDCGETLCVKVSINGNPTPDISWWRSGRQLQEDSRTEILVDGDRSILKIHNIEPNDEGEYVVAVSNELGSSSESFRVTVTDKPHPPEGRPVVSDVDWKSCVLCWQPPKYDGGSPITSYLIEKRSYDFGLCSLEIYNAKPSDTGQYTCVATNCFGTCSTTGYLRVGGERERSPESPRFEKLASDVTAVIGTTVTLEWLARGVPPPRVSWMKNTHRLQEDWRVDTYSNHRGLCRLVIRDVNPSDTDVYSCVIENESGKQTGMAMVLVQNGADENGNLKEITSRLLLNQQITEDFDENIESPEESNLSRWRHTHVGHNLYTANTRTSKLCSRFKDVTSGLPGRPLDPQVVEQGVTWVTLAWSRPLVDGGSPILAYKIEFRVLHSNQWHEIGLSRTTFHDVHGLQKNKTYCFRISAQNRFGWGPSVSLTHPVLMR
ncbi:cell adhesion molecule DSCAM-like isoform X2 [Tachypleus tridentatus]|uniref:cell adhesion molecule DSCAM-like isoform X2 n=1 Tax=Tachypleus tridentatus TaxID=6853 RepID=UPI003FD165FE